MKKNEIKIKKHSALMQMNSQNLTFYSKKLFNGIIFLSKKAIKDGFDAKNLQFTIGEIKKICGIKKTDNYETIRGLKTLRKCGISANILKKDKGFIYKEFSIISEFEYDSSIGKTGVFSIKITDSMFKMIKNPTIFSTLNLVYIAGLSSKYAISFYELLKDYEKKENWSGQLTIDLDELRAIVGVEDGKYPRFFSLKKRVIEPSIKQINAKTDIYVEYVFLKQKNEYKAIQFIISPQKNPQNKQIVALPSDGFFNSELKELGLSNDNIKKIINRYNEKDELLLKELSSIKSLFKKGKIKKLSAYANKVLLTSSLDEQPLFAQKVKKEKIKKQKEALLLLDEESKKQKEKEAEKNKHNNKIMDAFNSLPPEEQKKIKDEFSDNSNPTIKSIINKYGFDSRLVQGSFLKFVEKKISKKK